MFKRLVIVFILTGLGHVISIFALKFASENLNPDEFGNIAEIDTHLQFILSLIALGLQSKSIRDIAISDNWKNDFYKSQTARITLSLFIAFISIIAFKDFNYIIYSITPLLALNGDYALYARGFPIMGSLSAFLRTAIPLSALFISTVFYKEYTFIIYLISLFFVYFITNYIIANYLKVQLFFSPKITSLQEYLNSIPIGIITLGYYFLGLGLLIIANFFYSNSDVNVIFMLLKLYVIYKGVLRIIQQSFINELKHESNCLKIDKLSMICGLIFLSSTFTFPQSFINLFLGSKLNQNELALKIIGVSAFIYSIFTSMTTKALLNKHDYKLTYAIIIAVLGSFFTLIILSFIMNNINSIALSLLIGEILFAITLAKFFVNKNDILKRINYILKISPMLIGSLFIPFVIDDSMNAFISYIFIISSTLVILNKNSFIIQKL